ncbi:ABC transporter type 1, transmembrane domain-containing protein [Suillus subaureus]|uniref:ABC transporter type 1, transmembrane domain-containing protein n=1 Tax=Suillus subaureus TaxID=48587 RepID=A0A9P7DPP5_9AGAM|nr:ABC transporter type 1, transmembrane domain-containing protein [Suillus subaureus]KAG1799993.1 ABC transporter type 1, transmembrane domain-containing protein [Suillus subaureus]
MRWHDVTPAGRMLNRFGKDIETIDTNLAGSLSAVNSSLATFAAAIITVVVFFPIFLIPAVVIGFFYRLLALGYLKTGRDLRRMESNSRSPIFSGFSELLEGIVIRFGPSLLNSAFWTTTRQDRRYYQVDSKF